jgi:hypothetical protein
MDERRLRLRLATLPQGVPTVSLRPRAQVDCLTLTPAPLNEHDCEADIDRRRPQEFAEVGEEEGEARVMG